MSNNNKFKPGDVCILIDKIGKEIYYKIGVELYSSLLILKERKYIIPMEWWAHSLNAIFAPNKPIIILKAEICDTEKAFYYKVLAENKAIGWLAVPNPEHESCISDNLCLKFGLRKINE